MSGFDKTHRPERELAEKPVSTSAAPAAAAASQDVVPVHSEARMWRDLGATRTPETAGDAAQVAVEGRGAGAPVDGAIAAAVGAHTGVDVSGARVHSDPLSQHSTKAMSARAFAHGNDVFLGKGESATDTALVAHELTHVAQQRGGTATAQRKLAVGAAGDAHEQEADAIAAKVTSGATASNLLVDGGPLAAGQMLKQSFLDALKPHVVQAANAELGMFGSAIGCPYIAEYFQKYGALPASSTQALLRRWIPASAGVKEASALIPLVIDRVRAGVQYWKESKGKLPPDLAAAEPAAAQAAQAVTPTTPKAQRTSLEGMESELGAGEAADAKLAGAVGADGARIHRGPDAANLAREHDAVAFAVGNNVVMGANAPAQGTLAGDALLAHELAHTAQQKQAATDPVARKKPIGDEDQAAERDADRATAGAMSSQQKVATLGNFAGQVGDVMRTGLQLQRCAANGPQGVDVMTYLHKHEMEIAYAAARHIETLPFATGDAAVKWTAAGEKKFAAKLAQLLDGPDTADLDSLVRPERITEILDTSRIMNEETVDGSDGPKTMQNGYGPDHYFEAAGISVGNALARRTSESLRREVPRYVQARLASSGEPNPGDVMVSHPIDPLIVTALAVGGVLDIDRVLFAKEHPELAGAPKKQKDLRDVQLQVVSELWWRVLSPADATPEEVANTLFGTPTEAFRLENAHPLYGAHSDTRGGKQELDPLNNMPSEISDEVALRQAATLSGGKTHSAGEVLERIRTNSTLLHTSVRAAAARFGLGNAIDKVASVVGSRVAALEKSGEANIAKWDNQAFAQAIIINQAAQGLEACGLRLDTYAAQFKDDLRTDPGAFKLPDDHREVLRRDAELWVDALAVCDDVISAEQRLQTAGQHSATVDIEILERSLSAPQQAAFNGASDRDSKVNQDFDTTKLGDREIEMRKKLGQLRAQVIADPTAVDASAARTSEDTRDLVFESQVVLQAESVDQAWKILDDADGFWAHLTFDSGDLKDLKAEGAGYYRQWREVYKLIHENKKEDARTKYDELCGQAKLQTFLKRVNEKVADAQRHAMIAKLIAMVVITVASMGAGTLVEGLLGGGAAAAGAAEGAGAVTTGLGMSRTAASVAGFITETATFTLASNFAFDKDHSATALLTDFGKNIVLFGAMRGIGKIFEATGLAKIAEAGSKAGASGAAIAKAGAVQVFELVANGGVSVLAAIVEAKVREKLGGQKLTEEEVKHTVEMTVAQTVIMVMVGRLMKTPLNNLKLRAAYEGSKWRMARTAAQRLEAVTGDFTKTPPTPAQLRELIGKDLEQLQLEREAFEEVQAKLHKEGKVDKAIDSHVDELSNYEHTAKTLELMVGFKVEGPNHFKVDRVEIDEVLERHRKIGNKVAETYKDRSTGARTFVVTTETGDQIFITEDVEPKALTMAQQKLAARSVAPKAGEHIGDTVSSDFLSEDQSDAARWQTHALEDTAQDTGAKNPRAAEQAKQAKQWLADPVFRHWYDVWMSMPDRIIVDAAGKPKPHLPNGVPAEIGARLELIAQNGNIGLMTRALDISHRIEQEFPGLDPDPKSTAWQQARPKLVEMLGENQVKKYETEREGTQDAKTRQVMSDRLNQIVARGELDRISGLVPGAQVYVTGSAAQASKGVEKVTDLDLVVVVANNTPQRVRVELEDRLRGMKVESADDGKQLPIDAKVMTEEQFLGLSMARTPEARTPLTNYRVDAETTDVPGTGASGGDLHNHIMGVPRTQYFIDKVGGGSAVRTLEKTVEDLQDPSLWKDPGKPPVKAGVMQQLQNGLRDVHEAQRLGMSPDAVEARARNALDAVLSTEPQGTPFDHTYDVRDLLVQKHIDPNGKFENFGHDVISDLHDQGVTYSEQSVSAGKLEKRFTPEAMAKAHEKAKAEGKDSEVEFLVMVPTKQTLSAEKPASAETTTKENDALTKLLMRTDVKGIDVAAPEAQEFTKTGMDWLVEKYKLLDRVAQSKGQKMVLRPHVGEGYDPAGTGEHVAIARKNLEMLVKTLEKLGYDGSGNVIVRLGHATHATPEILADMARIGVIVESNVGSNLATGSILRAEEHPLLLNMYYGVKTVLATDAQGVMGTTLPAEYQRAAFLIDRFKAGEPLVVKGKTIYYRDLDAAQQKRFSVDWLKQQLDGYRRSSQLPVKRTAN